MKQNSLLILFITLCLGTASALAQSLEQTAGIYYAYPGPQGQIHSVPEGYNPVYVSHYGRHGSRWITEDKRYTDVTDVFDKAYADFNLTPLGHSVRAQLLRVVADALGKGGSLSPVGEKQHRGIAERLYASCPELFVDSMRINAVSSTSQRCILSMAAFCERLKELNPTLNVKRTAYDKDMGIIAYTSPEGKDFSADNAFWRKEHEAFCRESVKPQRLMASLFVNPDFLDAERQFDLMMGLYWIVSDMQDVDLDVNLDELLTYDERQAMWRTINARMYLCNADAPLAKGIMKHCADNLLSDIVTKADSALVLGPPSADLRFGHDTHLLRLLALMGIEGAVGQEEEMSKFHEAWRDYELSPMAGNLQLIFFRNAEGSVIVRVLLNENEADLPVPQCSPGFYSWPSLRDYLQQQMSAASAEEKALNAYVHDQSVKNMVIVECVEGSNAMVRVYRKDKGQWRQVMETDAFIGRNGWTRDKREGDGMTPIGDYGLLLSFGIKSNPGCSLPYVDVTPDTYAIDGPNEYYNQIVDAKAVGTREGEEMYAMAPEYNYGLALDYNKECLPGLGSNIFFHCKGSKPSTGGCVAVDEAAMIKILRLISPGDRICVIGK